MPTIQDEIWAAAWAACLKKAGVAETSPLWTENYLPSSVVEEEEEEGSLDRELNTNVSEQQVADADQVVDMTNLGQKEASDGPTGVSTAVEDTPAQATPPPLQDLIVDE